MIQIKAAFVFFETPAKLLQTLVSVFFLPHATYVLYLPPATYSRQFCLLMKFAFVLRAAQKHLPSFR